MEYGLSITKQNNIQYFQAKSRNSVSDEALDMITGVENLELFIDKPRFIP